MNDLQKHVEMLVRKAGKRVLEIYSTEFEVIRKTDGSPVTAADFAVQDIITHGLQHYGWPIVSEESEAPEERIGAPRVWILDPIDGTVGFVNKTGDFAIQLALVEDGKPIFGVVYQPAQNRFYYGIKGKGSKVIDENGVRRSLAVSSVSRLSDATLTVSDAYFDEKTKKELAEFGIDNILHISGVGNKIAFIVEKQAHLYATTFDGLGEWDICAPQIILEEAGGIMTGLNGEELTYNNKDPHNPHGVLATTTSLHPMLLEKIRSRNNIDMI